MVDKNMLSKFSVCILLIMALVVGGCANTTDSSSQDTCKNVYTEVAEKECIQVLSDGTMKGECLDSTSCTSFCTNVCNKEIGKPYDSYSSRIEDKLIGEDRFCTCTCVERVCI